MLRLRAGLSSLLLLLTFTATAGAAGWAPAPAEVMPPGAASVQPVGMAFAPDGTQTAAWFSGLGAADLVVADRPAGGVWGVPQRISGGASVSTADVASNAAGAMAAAWREGGYIRVATRAPGAAWEPVAVPLSGGGITSAPVVTLAPDGTVAVAWVDSGAVEVSVRGVAGAFSSPVTVPSGTTPDNLAIGSGPDSDILLVWCDTNGVQSRVMAAYRPAGGPSFKTPVAAVGVTPGANQSVYIQSPHIAFDTAGEITLVWLRAVVDTGANMTVTHWEGKWRTAGATGVFQGVVPHDLETKTVNSTLPSGFLPGVAAADGSGRTSFVWPALQNGGGLDMASRVPGSGFAATQTIEPSGTFRIDVAGAGSNLLVVNGKAPAVATAAPGAPLGAFDATPFPTTGMPGGAVVAGDEAGDAAVTWSSKDGSTYHLQSTVYDATAPVVRDLAVPATATAGTPAAFSVTPWDALTTASATWDFGDGTTAAGSAVQHAFDTPGDRTVTVTVTDQGGNAVSATRTIAVAAAPPAAPAPAPTAATALVLDHVKLSRTHFTVGKASTPMTGRAARARKVAGGTVLRWRLSAAATLRATVKTVASRGHRARTIGTLRRTAAAGAGQLKFSGRLGRRALAPGRYRLSLAATDAAGHKTKTVALSFTIVRG